LYNITVVTVIKREGHKNDQDRFYHPQPLNFLHTWRGKANLFCFSHCAEDNIANLF